MSTVLPKLLIDDVVLHKTIAAKKMAQVLDVIDNSTKEKMIRTASVSSNKLITLLTSMLDTLNMKAKDNNIQEIVNKISTTDNDLNKNASINKNSMERRDDIKIVSKSVKDSHYQIDLSKDVIQKAGKRMIMVSCYARDSYLGRYLIKRNYFYTEDRNQFADSSYDEILSKVAAIKDRYYNEIIDIGGIFSQLKQSLDGVISEIEIKEDSLGTTVTR